MPEFTHWPLHAVDNVTCTNFGQNSTLQRGPHCTQHRRMQVMPVQLLMTTRLGVCTSRVVMDWVMPHTHTEVRWILLRSFIIFVTVEWDNTSITLFTVQGTSRYYLALTLLDYLWNYMVSVCTYWASCYMIPGNTQQTDGPQTHIHCTK